MHYVSALEKGSTIFGSCFWLRPLFTRFDYDTGNCWLCFLESSSWNCWIEPPELRLQHQEKRRLFNLDRWVIVSIYHYHDKTTCCKLPSAFSSSFSSPLFSRAAQGSWFIIASRNDSTVYKPIFRLEKRICNESFSLYQHVWFAAENRFDLEILLSIFFLR